MNDSLRLIAPDPRIHADAMSDMIAKVFSQGGYYDMRDRCNGYYIRHGNYDWQASRIGLIGEKIVTHLGVWDYQMRIGSARVRTGGVGVVATDADFRRRGLMAETAQAGIDAMCEQGYDMTLLFGIWNFYDRFGYVNVWPWTSWHVSVDQMPTPRPGIRLRKFTPHHRDDLAALYNRQNARLTGTAVRPTYLRCRPGRQGHLWTDTRGAPAGYVVTGVYNSRFECSDFAGDPELVLAALARLARKGNHREVVFGGLHYESALATRLRRGNCRVETGHSRSGGPMVRTLSLRSTLAKISGELTRRLKASHLAGWRGKLLIADGREKLTLTIGRGGVRVAGAGPSKHAIRGGDEVTRLLIGSDHPLEVAQAGRIRLTGDAKQLVTALFPNQHPMLATVDRF